MYFENSRADQVEVLDSKTIMLKEFYYDGKGGKGVHFTVGRGPQPSSKGTVVPNELGYLEPLRRYQKEDIKLQLPGKIASILIVYLSK